MEHSFFSPEALIQRKEILKNKRASFENLWQEVSELVLPRKADFTISHTTGSKRNRKLFETTAVNASEFLAAGLHGLLTNPAVQWFSLTLKNKDVIDDCWAQWLQKVENIMFREIARPSAGFSTNIHEIYLDLAVLGTTGLYVGWSNENDSLLFQSRFLGNLYIDENDAGQVDTIFRMFKWPLKKIVKTWGENALSENLRLRYQNQPEEETEYEIMHAIFPNPRFKKTGLFQKPVSSVYLLVQERCILFEGGFNEMPFFVARWTKATGEVYGRSPAISVLPDIKMLQEMMKETIIAAQLANRPPLLVKDDEQFSPRATVPGGILRYSGEAPKPFLTQANSSVGLGIMNEIRQRLRTAFFNDELSMPDGKQMTATEVIQRTEEKMRLLGPALGRIQTELLGPMISRIFGLLKRHGKIPPPPEEIDFNDLHVEYLSPLALAQKRCSADALAQMMNLSAGFIKLDPSAVKVFNIPEILRTIARMYGSSPLLIRSEKELTALKDFEKEL